ncbi:MAG: hypothetical protein OHK006_23900 [Thermodesulfovibrionales bacterium]
MNDHCKDFLVVADTVYGLVQQAEGRTALIVRSGRIAYIGPEKPLRTLRQGLAVLRIRNLAPLFCDYHLHLRCPDSLECQRLAEQLLSHGIGQAYDAGSMCVKRSFQGRTLGKLIRIRTARHAVSKKGGYGGFIGCQVSGLLEAAALIDRLADSGADYLKVVHSGIYDPETDSITAGGFAREELKGIVRHAEKRGLRVFCHVNGQRRVAEAVDAGVSCVIHGLGISATAMKRMSAQGVAFIPTIHAFETLSKIARTPAGRNNIAARVRGHLSAAREAFELGVPVLPGSDSGSSLLPYGAAFQAELSCFRKAGIPLHSIIHAAAISGLRQGMPADFQELEGIRPKRVFIRGEMVAKE